MAASPTSAIRKSITVFSSTPALRSRLVAKLNELGRYAVREQERAAFFEAGSGDADQLLAVLDVGDGSLLDDPRMAKTRERLAGLPIIVVSEVMPPERMRNAVRLQAADWLQEPFSDSEFAASVAHVEGASVSATSRVSTFIGASGGAGGTGLALMAARHLAQGSAAGETCLVDLDFQSANCSAYLNIANKFDLDGLIANPERLDGELLDLIKLDRNPGITLYSFERPDVFFAPTGKRFVLRLLDLVALRHRDVVIDLPNLATPWFEQVVGHSDKLFLVFEPNIPSMRQARRAMQRIREIRGPGGDVVAIANKTAFKLFGNTISRKDIDKMLGAGKVRTIGRDDELATDALNRALLPTEAAPRSKLARDASAIFQSAFGTSSKNK